MDSYKSFLKQRDANQNEIASLFAQSEKNITLIESPTGSGKTRIALLSALEKQKKSNMPIIISTNTNKNAIDLRRLAMLPTEHESKGFGLSEDEVVVEVGMSNYINISLLAIELMKDSSILPIKIEDIDKKYKLSEDFGLPLYKTDVLKEDFVNEFTLDEKKYPLHSFLQSQSDILGKKELIHISQQLSSKKIIITNHIYLIVLYRFFGNFKNRAIDDETRELFLTTPIIIDEFHTLYDAAKIVLTNTFSLFQLKNSLNGVLENLPSSSNKTLTKKLESIRNTSLEIQNSIKSIESEKTLEKVTIGLVAELKQKANSRNGIEATIKQLQKLDVSQNDTLERYTFSLIKELSELANVNLSSNKTKVSFSPKGYPSFILSNGIPSYKLRSELWIKCNAPVLGMSGTIRTVDNTHKESYRWITERNGLFKVEIAKEKEKLENKEFDYLQKESILAKHAALNDKIENISFVRYESLFNKSNFLMHFFTDKELQIMRHPSSKDSKEYKDEYSDKKDIWYDNICNTISNVLSCNSLILTMSFDDVNEIHKRLKDLRSDVKFCIAEQGKSMNSVIEKHRNNVDNNTLSCIIGTEQYYTGLDLKGEYLKEIFMVKLPYKPILGEIGKKIYPNMSFSKDESYENEVMFKILQGAGRGIRDYNDKAILYILDPRLNKKHSETKVFLQHKGHHIEIESLLKSKDKFLECKSLNPHKNIILFLSSVFISKNIQQITDILKIDDLQKAEIACRNLNKIGVSISKYGREEFKTDIQSQKYDFWVHLLKITLKNNKLLGGIDYEAKIIKNNLFGFKTIKDLSKDLLTKEENIDDTNHLFSLL